mgnify:CR=1 FL=1
MREYHWFDRGTFIEFRSGMINVCPVGRSCSQAQRDEFAAYDKEHKVREALVAKLRAAFPNDGFVFAIGELGVWCCCTVLHELPCRWTD